MISRNNESFGSGDSGCEFQQPQFCIHNVDYNTGPFPKLPSLSLLICKSGNSNFSQDWYEAQRRYHSQANGTTFYSSSYYYSLQGAVLKSALLEGLNTQPPHSSEINGCKSVAECSHRPRHPRTKPHKGHSVIEATLRKDGSRELWWLQILKWISGLNFYRGDRSQQSAAVAPPLLLKGILWWHNLLPCAPGNGSILVSVKNNVHCIRNKCFL